MRTIELIAKELAVVVGQEQAAIAEMRAAQRLVLLHSETANQAHEAADVLQAEMRALIASLTA